MVVSGWSIMPATQCRGLYQSRDYQEQQWIARGAWPEFLRHNRATLDYASHLDEHCLEFQCVAISSREVIAVAHSIPLCIEVDDSDLPNDGWEWALTTGARQYRTKVPANVLCGLSITVSPENQKKGLGARLVNYLRDLAFRKGLTALIVPVRPLEKAQNPTLPMSEFMSRTRQDGYHIDPWIRTHQRLGGRIISICERSMLVSGSLTDWRSWTGIELKTGQVSIVPGALAPLIVDSNMATYVEPNVWMKHTVGEQPECMTMS
jgi:GNAT superfamily N-acetyltransferase